MSGKLGESLKGVVLDRVRRLGPIPFEEFMSTALYHPDRGFFSSTRLRSRQGGDFLTSPEVSPMFGETLGAFVKAERERIGDPFLLVEAGAGSGSLLGPLLSATGVEALAVEVSPPARESLTTVVGPDRVTDRLPERIRGVVIANELLDNLPMALAQKVGGGWRERWVGAEGDRLVWVDAPPREQVLAWLAAYAGEVTEGGWVEVQLEAWRWVSLVVSALEGGALLVIDYGDTADALASRRAGGTLRTYRAHHLGPHPLDEPGETDITADVNFTALLDAAAGAGAEVDLHRQDDFLASWGLRHRLSRLRHHELEAARSGEEAERLRLRTMRIEAETLLHPRGLGDFRVLLARV